MNDAEESLQRPPTSEGDENFKANFGDRYKCRGSEPRYNLYCSWGHFMTVPLYGA